MNKIQCIYPNRDAVLVAYLYDDIAQDERVAFEGHLAACRWCDDELDSLRGVRETLGQWAPPEPARTFANFEMRATSNEQRATSNELRAAWWHNVPVWAQVAAAMLVLGASASIANLDIRYDRAGLSVRTGWSKPAPVPAATAAPQAAATTDAAPWRADLAALRSQMQSEMHAQSATVRAASTPAPAAAMAATTPADDDEFSRRARALLADSEKRQQKELAVRLVQLQADFDAQLQVDRGRTNQLFRDVTNSYGSQIQNQQRQINGLLPLSAK